MNTSTMTIGKKLTAGFAVLGLMMAFIGGFSLLQFGNMNRAAIGFTDSILPAVVRTSTLGETINTLRRYELDVFLVAVGPAAANPLSGSQRAEPARGCPAGQSPRCHHLGRGCGGASHL